MDMYVAFTVFAFVVGPGVHTTPLYSGDSQQMCEQTAAEYNEVYKDLDYRTVVCLRASDSYDPAIDSEDAIYMHEASSSNKTFNFSWSD